MRNVLICDQWFIVRNLFEGDVGEQNPAPAGCAGDFFAEAAWHVTGAVSSSSSSPLFGPSTREGTFFLRPRDVP